MGPWCAAQLVARTRNAWQLKQEDAGVVLNFRETDDGIGFIEQRPTRQIAAELHANYFLADAVDRVHASTISAA
jgi:hypothetical protein